jgi:hypothetical protein
MLYTDAGDDGTLLYLASDNSLDCSKPRYDGMVAYAAIMVMVYPLGCPLLLFTILFRHRERLDPRGVTEEGAIEAR